MNIDFASVATIPVPDDIEALIFRPGLRPLSDKQFAEFCAQHPDLRVEMNREGEMIIMLPVVSRGGRQNFNLTGRFFVWCEPDGSGVGFDSSTGFTLRNGAKRSPVSPGSSASDGTLSLKNRRTTSRQSARTS